MPNTFLVSQGIVEPLADFISARGGAISSNELARQLGRVTQLHGEPQVAANSVVNLFEKFSADLRMPGFGVEYARAFPVGGTGAFGFILTHGKTMRTSVMAIARYTRIVMSGVDVRYEPIEGGGQLSWTFPLGVPSPLIQFNSFVAALVILRLRSGLAGDWQPKHVQLAHKDPGAKDVYRRVFGKNVSFEQPVNRFIFADANLDKPNFSADPRLFKVVQQLGDILLSELKTVPDFRTAVGNKILELLGMSDPALSTVAKALHLGERTVQRRLAKEGTSYESLLSDTRQSVAERLLCNTELPMTDIAFMLGFSELSAFTRAAKRWYGVSPRQFRSERRPA